MATLRIRQPTVTEPQRKFWNDDARFRAFIGGVGSGKTHIGSLSILDMPESLGVVAAPTYVMLRDATLRTFMDMVRPTGLLANWKASEMLATLKNGTEVMFRTADDPEKLRGPNIGWFWLDEAALMTAEAWNIMLGRLRQAPGRAWVTTTPRGANWIYDRWQRAKLDGYSVTRSSSRDNVYLPADFIGNLETAYTNRFARQEIEGEFLLDTPGALWTTANIDETRKPAVTPDDLSNFVRIVVGVDPKASVEADSKTGIMVVGRDVDNHLNTLEDASIDASPDTWGRRVSQMYHKWSADRVVAEINQGGDMVTSVLRTIDPSLPIRTVRATKGKYVRAEPIAALWEQGKAHMAGTFPMLEEQMCSWVPGDDSPDNLDAYVWAATELDTRMSLLL